MKTLFSLIISAALVVSCYSQTRNVLVGTNNAVVQPTNFWSVDASNARAGLGLGSAATNLSSAFQPSSATLSNLASSNAINLTNIRATNLVGLIPSSNIPTTLTNITGTLSITQGGTGATNSSGARASLELGTAATNPSTAFQAASSALTNLAANNGANLTNIPLSGVVNALASNGNAINLTNLTAANITGTVALASNVTGTIAIGNGGSGATTVGGARTNLGLGWSALTNTNATNFRTAIGLGWSALTNTNATNFRADIGLGGTNTVLFNSLVLGGENSSRLAASPLPPTIFWPTNSFGPYEFYAPAASVDLMDVDGYIFTVATNGNSLAMYGNFSLYGDLQFGFASNAATSRTNLGLGATWLTNTNASLFREAVGLGTNDSTIVSNATVNGNLTVNVTNVSDSTAAALRLNGTNSAISFGTNNTAGAAITRTNLGLGWSALTNSNSGTSLVSVNTNGVVVSPTNFWQVAPIQTLVQDSTLIGGTQTNNATNARNLYVYSLNTNLGGVSNTILLPTNAATFAGDEVTVIHQGTTNTTTVVRQAGSTNNLITLNRFDEAVKFIRESEQWNFYHNISFVEPIQFSGTNTAANALASRINLGFLVGPASNSFLGGGTSNTATSSNAFVGAGINNVAGGNRSFVGGGAGNSASTLNAVVVGGNGNLSSGIASFVGGGEFNIASGSVGCVTVGGVQNTNSADYGAIIGGYLAEVTAQYGVALGGSRNKVTGEFSMAAGRRANATNAGSFVWSDNENVEFYSTNTNSFNIRARGGMSVDLGTSGIIFRQGAEQTRTNLGLGLPALTNSDTTNFQAAVFQTNTAPVSGGTFGAHAAWMEVNVITNGSNVSFRIPLYK